MTDDQALKTGDEDRLQYARQGGRPGWRPTGKPWYADTTRESIRDDTIRNGLVAIGAAVPEESVQTTSTWQSDHLTPGALARVKILRAGAAAGAAGVKVVLPNGETKLLGSGESARLKKGVIEEFAPRFLVKPALIWLSESGRKVITYYDDLARAIGLSIAPEKNLPDVILVDLGTKHRSWCLLRSLSPVARLRPPGRLLS